RNDSTAMGSCALPERQEGHLQLTLEPPERPSCERPPGQIPLKVEAFELDRDPRITNRRDHLVVAAQRAALAVNDRDLELGPHRHLTDSEAGPTQHLLQYGKTLVQPTAEVRQVRLCEVLLRHLRHHPRIVRGGRASPAPSRNASEEH